MKKTIYLLFTTALLCAGFTACGDDDEDVKLPDITVNFGASELGIDEETASVEAAINLSRAHTAALDVTVKAEVSGLTYGDDFTTVPAVQDAQIKVTIPAGSTTASFSISKVNEVLFEGTETINFSIQSLSVTEGVVIGDKKDLKLSFAAIVSEGEQLTLQGRSGDVAYANQVYVDFSTNTQVSVDRKSWYLGFYGGAEYHVVLNSAYAVTATASTKSDIAAVTIDDANAALNIGASAMSEEGLSSTAVDSYDGALSGTVFASVSANDEENKVYFVASENDKASRDKWYKVKVSRNGEGYKVQYAKVTETTITTVEVAKNAAYNFAFLSLETAKTVNVEPVAKNWDIAWTYGCAATMGSPYFMQDLVLLNNIGGAEAVEVLTSSVEYAALTLAQAKALTLLNAKNVIANNWRTTANMGGSTGAIGVKSDRFYVVKDPAGNYYKLRFLKMGLNNDGGVRGNPQIEYALLK